MHIAKGAGSTVNEQISKQFLENETVSHFESLVDVDDNFFDDKKYISGHPFYYSAKKRLPHLDDYYKTTVLREPIRQLISHIAWVRGLAEPKNIYKFHAHATHFQDMAIRLKNIDLSSPKELRFFSNNLSQPELVTFCNFQTRYFTPKHPDNISKNDYSVIGKMLDEFDLIGTTELLDVFFNELFSFMNWQCPKNIIKMNVATDYFGLDPTDKAQQDALYPLIRHDLVLYDMVKNSGKLKNAREN